MPMLHGCGFQGCTTLTLSAYCVEHELFVRALKETERSHAAHPLEIDAEAPLAAAAVADEAHESASF